MAAYGLLILRMAQLDGSFMTAGCCKLFACKYRESVVQLDESFAVVNCLLVNIANGMGWYKDFKKAALSCHQHRLHHSTSSSQHQVRKLWSLPSIYRVRMRFRQYGTPEGVHYLSVVRP